ncbi:hypothetical protein [Aurantimonas sp. VKM B-3413]|uniref:hypothetical protein n=1 Tax=Aurantimonas sp. VKM B-3413 TaxID=2779401 RepID=UPI001E654C94|nr:hypothetical protein [Aurantimonas sp. VKM B-3413]MCB8840613.1 hypothetical protein [Aurantimonas sp. VKM B-3413]
MKLPEPTAMLRWDSASDGSPAGIRKPSPPGLEKPESFTENPRPVASIRLLLEGPLRPEKISGSACGSKDLGRAADSRA